MGNKCGIRFTLNKLTFSDPTNESDEITWHCLEHSNDFISKMYDDIKGIETQIKLIDEKLSITNRTPDINFDKNDKIMQKHLYDETGRTITLKERRKKLNDIKKDMMWSKCRHPNCHEKMQDDTIIYSVVVFSGKGRMRKTLYFHKKCWELVKGQCGLQRPIHSGQLQIEQVI